MLIFLNGQLVPEEQAVISVFDRGFLYGDGLFETIRVFNGKLFRWGQHLERLRRGADFLKIAIPFPGDDLLRCAGQLIEKNKMPDALLRLTLTRGVGPRGYSPKGADIPSLVMSMHPAPKVDPENPPPWKLLTSSVRLPANQTLAQYKTCNKLPQILARSEADIAGADEALLLNTDEVVVEGASSNLFWVHGDVVCTPPLFSGILPGVTRAIVLELCESLQLRRVDANIRAKELRYADGIFLSLSSLGIVDALSLNGHTLKQSAVSKDIRKAYLELLRSESA